MSANHDSDVYSGAAFIFPAAEAKVGLTFDVAAGSLNVFINGLSDPGDLNKTIFVGDKIWVAASKEMREVKSISYDSGVLQVDRVFAAPLTAEPLFISKNSSFSEVSITGVGGDVQWDSGFGFKTFKGGLSRTVVKGDQGGTGVGVNVNNFVIDATTEDVVVSYSI